MVGREVFNRLCRGSPDAMRGSTPHTCPFTVFVLREFCADLEERTIVDRQAKREASKGAGAVGFVAHVPQHTAHSPLLS